MMSVCPRPAGKLFHMWPWASSHETSVSNVAVGPPNDTSPQVGRTQLTMTFLYLH